MGFNKHYGRLWVGLIWHRVAVFGEHGNEFLVP